ncbi:MAG: Transcriptional regulator [Myxococcales bacterium]|nr:Transcriptional regulator [Myxococcales bacterium]
MRIQVLVLDGVFDIGLAAVLDTLATANDLAGDGRSASRFVVERVGLRRRVQTQQGLIVPVEPAGLGRAPDLVVVPALGCKTPETLTAALARRDVAEAGAWLRHRAKAGARVAAACTATFVLAESGLLDGRVATTTWWLAPLFRQRYPKVELDDSRMIVEAGRFASAGAALAHLDLALWLVRRRSPALAALTARYLILDSRSSQASYAIPDHLAHADPAVERFEKWARRHLVDRFSLEEAARAVGTSERTLARRLHRVLGKTPLEYVQDLRVERAVHLLQTSDGTVDEIAAEVGYGDGVTLRTLLRRKTGRGVRELRVRN